MAAKPSWFTCGCLLLLAIGFSQAAPVTKNQETPQGNQAKAEGATEENELQALTGQESPAKPEEKEQIIPVAVAPQVPAKPVQPNLEAETVPQQGVPQPQAPAQPQPQGEEAVDPQDAGAMHKRGDEPTAVEDELPAISEDGDISEEELALPKEMPQGDLFEPEVDLSPRAVAEYLLVTGDFKGFENAVEDILRSQIMSPDEAQEYRDAVGLEYETLLRRMTQNAYLQELIENEPVSEVEYQEPPRIRAASMADLVDDNMSDMPEVDLGMALKQLQMRAMLEKEENEDQLLESMVEDYLAQQRDRDDGMAVDETELAQMIDLMGDELQGEDQELPPAQAEEMMPEMPSEEEQQSQEQEQEQQSEQEQSQEQEPDVVEQLEETSGAQKAADSSDKSDADTHA